MKTRYLYILALILTLGLFSCEKGPFADFTASEAIVETGEIIDFTNTSLRADYFEWNFDDGDFSTKVHPGHFYSDAGLYRVSLSAFSHGGDMMDVAYLDITVLQPTSLEITVMEYYDEYIVPDVEIMLFTSLQDWDDNINGEFIGLTGNNGKIFIEGLNPIRYYVDCYNEEYNNYTLAEEDIGFIETDALIANSVNYFTAWVDYDPGPVNKSEAKNIRIKKFERRKIDKY